MDDPNDPFWLFKPPYTLFDFGIFLLFLGALYFDIEKVWVRFSGWVYRDKEPRSYWWNLAFYFLGGAFLIWLFFVEIHRTSN